MVKASTQSGLDGGNWAGGVVNLVSDAWESPSWEFGGW